MAGTWLPPEQYIATLPKATAYACLYVTDEAERPVQLRSVQNPKVWQWPGGNMDPGETPWQCAQRECLEETGLRLDIAPRLLAVHFLPPLGSWSLNKIGFIFDGGRLSAEQIASIVLDPDEHTEVSVRSLDDWEEEMSSFNFRRLAAVAQAQHTGTACYLEQHPDPA